MKFSFVFSLTITFIHQIQLFMACIYSLYVFTSARLCFGSCLLVICVAALQKMHLIDSLKSGGSMGNRPFERDAGILIIFYHVNLKKRKR